MAAKTIAAAAPAGLLFLMAASTQQSFAQYGGSTSKVTEETLAKCRV